MWAAFSKSPTITIRPVSYTHLKNTFSFIWKSESHKPILTDGNTVINIVDKNNINKIDYIFNPIYVYDSYKPTDTSIENLDKYKHFNENNYYEVNQIDDETYVDVYKRQSLYRLL